MVNRNLRRDYGKIAEADGSVNAPHHFLKADEKMKEEAKSRDWIMARITGTEEAVAGDVGRLMYVGSYAHRPRPPSRTHWH